MKMQRAVREQRINLPAFDLRHKRQPQLQGIIWAFGAAFAFLVTGCDQVISYLPPKPRIDIPLDKPPTSPVPAQTSEAAEIEAAVRQRVNEVRQQNGLRPLQDNERLAQLARNYSWQMAEKNFFSHTGADGSTPNQRVRVGRVSFWVVAENLFKSPTNISQPGNVAVESWLKSPEYRENILRPVFTQTGVGVWRTGNTYYITQLYLRP